MFKSHVNFWENHMTVTLSDFWLTSPDFENHIENFKITLKFECDFLGAEMKVLYSLKYASNPDSENVCLQKNR